KSLGTKLVIGSGWSLLDAPRVVLWTTERASYGRLSRLITLGRRRAPKGEFHLSFEDLAEYADGLMAGIALDVHDPTAANFDELSRQLGRYRELFADRCYLLGELYCGPNDGERLARIAQLSHKSGVPLVAAGDVHYHQRYRLALQDVLTAIRLRCTVTEAGEHLFPNAERCLKTVEQMQARFAAYPE